MTLRIAIVILGLLLGLFSHQVAFASGGFDGLYSNKNSFIFAPNLKLKAERHATLIYITADTHEPFMKIAIDKEVMELKQLCGPTLANWATILGSKLQTELLHGRPLTFDLCNFGKLYENVPFPKDLKESINTVYQKYQSNHQMIIPTAIPEIYELILSRLVNRIFNKDKTYFFVHTKAHGTKDFPIINLSNENIEKKHSKQLESFEPKLRKEYADLSENAKLGEGKLASFLKAMTGTPAEHLGTIRNNDLSANISDLTNTEKLFSQKAFEDIFVNLQRQNVIIAFLFLESCSTPVPLDENDRDPRWFIDEVPVLSYYMAKGYLGYNNLEWSRVFQKPDWLTNTPQLMYDSLKTHLPFIENRFSEQPERPEETNNRVDAEGKSQLDKPNVGPFHSITAGLNQTCAITRKSRTLVCWGTSQSREDENSGTEGHFTKAKIDEGTQHQKVVIGPHHACALTVGGIIKCWGKSHLGGLGRGKSIETESEMARPLPIADNNKFIDVAVGEDESCGITVSKELRCWGGLKNEELYSKSSTAVDIENITVDYPETKDSKARYLMVALAHQQGCGITVEQKLKCWNNNFDNSMNTPDNETSNGKPVEIDSTDNYTFVGLGPTHSCAINVTGKLKCWGANNDGVLGPLLNYQINVKTPTIIDQQNNYKMVALGSNHTCGITTSSKPKLKCWGNTNDGKTEMPPSWKLAEGDSLKQVSLGDGYSCLTTENGFGRCWGNNLKSAIKPQSKTTEQIQYASAKPLQIKDTDKYSEIAAGPDFTCGITINQKLKCWGNIQHFGFQRNTNPDLFSSRIFSPNLVESEQSFQSLAVSSSTICAARVNGSFKCWGESPILKNDDEIPRKFALADGLGCLLTKSNRLKCWGRTKYLHQTKDSDGIRYGPTPTIVDPEVPYIDISVDDDHLCGVTEKNGLKCWGLTSKLPNGNPFAVNSNTIAAPLAIDQNTKYESVYLNYTKCALQHDGKLKCWSNLDSRVIKLSEKSLDASKPISEQGPFLIHDNFSFSNFAVSPDFMCGISISKNALYCWGINEKGRLGNGNLGENTTEDESPVEIDPGTPYKTITTGEHHGCGITQDGTAKCWGSNEQGQLGIGTDYSPFQR